VGAGPYTRRKKTCFVQSQKMHHEGKQKWERNGARGGRWLAEGGKRETKTGRDVQSEANRTLTHQKSKGRLKAAKNGRTELSRIGVLRKVQAEGKERGSVADRGRKLDYLIAGESAAKVPDTQKKKSTQGLRVVLVKLIRVSEANAEK